MTHVTVIGGGFSGLTTAYYLARAGVAVTVLEKQGHLGGLIGTVQTEHGPVERAANGIRSTARVEALFADLELPLVQAKKASNARYLYRGRPRRWPLGPLESVELGARLAASAGTGRFRPRTAETIAAWSTRVFGGSASHYIVGAALQGIYAGDPMRMSASLIFGAREKPARGRFRGLVAPPEGMSQLIDTLERRLLKLGVTIRRNALATEDVEGTVVVCTSVRDAAGLLAKRAPETAEALANVEMLPLVRVNVFYPPAENTIGGFGVLFPRGEGVGALGVLFNTNIFPERGTMHSESWILGGAQQPDVLARDDEALVAEVARDRERLYGRKAMPLGIHVQRWPAALPHYDVAFERIRRRGLDTPPDTFLAGNYVRGIGLPMLLERAWDVAQQVRQPAQSRGAGWSSRL